jgi:hypothetical protein
MTQQNFININNICFIVAGGTIMSSKIEGKKIEPNCTIDNIIFESTIRLTEYNIVYPFSQLRDSIKYRKEEDCKYLIKAIKTANEQKKIPVIIYGTDSMEFYSKDIIFELNKEKIKLNFPIFFISSMKTAEHKNHITSIFNKLKDKISQLTEQRIAKEPLAYIFNQHCITGVMDFIEIDGTSQVKKILAKNADFPHFIKVDLQDYRQTYAKIRERKISIIIYQPNKFFEKDLQKAVKSMAAFNEIIIYGFSGGKISPSKKEEKLMVKILEGNKKIILSNLYTSKNYTADGEYYKAGLDIKARDFKKSYQDGMILYDNSFSA